MENAHAIHWYLFWEHSIEFLNDLVTESFNLRNFDRVKILCKVIALKSMGMTAEEFWIKNLTGITTKSLVVEDCLV